MNRWILAAAVAVAIALTVNSAGFTAGVASAVRMVPGKPTLGLGDFDLGALGYEVSEHFISGEATSYRAVGDLGEDGRWVVEPAGKTPYTTRLVVVKPRDPAKFNGTVLVEWLNVSAGTDGAPDWNYLHRELIRSGYAWVGVSAQKAGIEGSARSFPGAMPLKKADAARYAPLNHPGDAYAYDIFTQAGRVVQDSDLLGPLKVERVLAAGESQSAGFLTTYINAIAPRAKTFDGYLVHSRFGSAAPLEGGYVSAVQQKRPHAVRFRTDLPAPVLTFITETDLMAPGTGYLGARQPDTDRLRVWEVAGTAHADTYTLTGAAVDSGFAPIEELAAAYTPVDNLMGLKLGAPMNAAPQHHYVLQAALASLDRWVRTGAPPPMGDRLRTTEGPTPALVLDAHGNATGGIRSPWMDAPTARLSGLGQPGGGFAALFGVTEPFDPARLQATYPGGRDEYFRRFDTALEDAVAKGFILSADAPEIRALARAMYPKDAP